MKVVFTEQSLISLQEAFDFLLEQRHLSSEKAHQFIDHILDRTNELEQYPELGQIEDFLSHLKMGHRRIIEGHIKIIYRIEKETIYITDFFDSRQDPNKMKA